MDWGLIGMYATLWCIGIGAVVFSKIQDKRENKAANKDKVS